MRKVIALCLCLLAFSTSKAEFISGSELVEWAAQYDKSQSEATDTNFINASAFRSYVTGVVDALAMMEHLPGVPSGAKQSQIAAIVSSYIRKNPKEWHLSGSFLVYKAITQAFPNQKR